MENNVEGKCASAGNQTRVNCLEGSYAHYYAADASVSFWQQCGTPSKTS